MFAAFLAPFLNGHSFNGNDSDSEEFSDTLEQVNEVSLKCFFVFHINFHIYLLIEMDCGIFILCFLN